jgi:hypothetical protein
MYVKNVPGRKTDVNDAMWLADLLAQGLIRASFVPPMAVQALRDLTRSQASDARKGLACSERIDKTLQAANLKLGSVLSDIMGASGRAILNALAQGETDPASPTRSIPGSTPPAHKSSKPCAAVCATTSVCRCGSTSPRPMPPSGPSTDHDPRRQRCRRCRRRLRDRRRHDALPNCRTPVIS